MAASFSLDDVRDSGYRAISDTATTQRTKQKVARPKSGRLLQRQLLQLCHGFVEASPSLVLRDG
jgi:hypothetical protein